MNLKDNLFAALSNIDLHKVLTHHGVRKADSQRDDKTTAYFCPFCKEDKTPHFRINQSSRYGGTYNSLQFSCSRKKIVGYGSIELEAQLSGLSTTGEDLLKVLSNLSQIQDSNMVELDETNRNGFVGVCDPLDGFSMELMDGFTPEGLQAIGCRINRMYEEKDGSRTAIENGGEPVFLYSFGSDSKRAYADKSNFEPERLHREFNLYQVKSYTSNKYWENKKEVSLKREAHALFPIFAFVYTAKNGDGKDATWGQVIQPEWRSEENNRPCQANFYFYTDGLNAHKVNRKLLGDMVCNHVFGGMMVRDAVAGIKTGEYLKLTKIIQNEDEKGNVTEEEVDLMPEDIRVDNVILCKDGINAVSAYYHLNSVKDSHPYNSNLENAFFHTVWMVDYSADFTTYMFSLLKKLGTNKFLMFDIDNFGKKKSFQICKRFTKFRMAFLPERLKDSSAMYMGGKYIPCRDIRSFFSKYRMSEEEQYGYEHDINLLFLSCFTSALPIEPLVYCEKRDKKSGKLLEYFYKMDSACLWQFMATEGYCREVEHDSSDAIGRFLHIDGPFVKELDVKSLLAATTTTLSSFAQRTARPGTEDYRKMSNSIINAKEIAEKTAVNLPEMDVDYRSGYGPTLDHFFYRNGVLEITPEEISFKSYNNIDFCVDRSEILPFDFIMPCGKEDTPFSISENPEYKVRMSELELHRKDTSKYTQEGLKIEEQEIMVWAQRNRWKFQFRHQDAKDWWKPMQVIRCFANEEFEKEEDLMRAGGSFDEEDEKTLLGHLANIIYSLGRPLFRYRGGGTNYMPYITENGVSKEGRSEGGSGKSVFVNVFMGCAGKIFRVDGRKLKIDGDITLELANYIHHGHRVIHWEDYAKGMPIDPIFNFITSGFQYRKRHKDESRVLLKDSPGHVTTSNFQQTYEDPSASGRVVPTGFSHRFNRGDIRKNKPARKISDVMPGLRDDPEDMDIELRSQIAYICAMAVQFCMKTNDRVLPPMDDLNYRSRVASMGCRFMDWAESFFSKDYVMNCPIDMGTIFDEYVEFCESSEDKKNKFAISAFKGKIEEYCGDIGFVMLPDVCFSSPTDKKKGYMRVKAWCREVYFDDEKIWGKDMKKEIRVLKQSNKCVFFCKKGEEPANNEEVKTLCKEYYKRPDPEPMLDPDDNPVELTAEELEKWTIYTERKQGRFRSQTSAPAVEAGELKTGKSNAPDDLPF